MRMGYRSFEPADRACNFCGRSRAEVKKLVAGPSAFICDRCVLVCRQLLVDERRMQTDMRGISFRPRDLKERLDEWVVGQEHAKRMLSVAVYNHMKRVALKNQKTEIEIQKSNIVLMGPPGTGKTHLARTLAKLIDVPFALADATPLTQAGYVGEDVESIVAKLLRAAENDPERAARGIIYIDEIDKLARRPGHDRDVSGEGVQQSLLKLLEGKKVVVRMGADRSGLGGEPIEVDTSSVLFIGGGAFDGLARGIEARGRETSGFRPGGRTSDAEMITYSLVTPRELHKFGFLPEFIGRFPVLVPLSPFGEDELVKVLTGPRNALLRQYQRLFSIEGSRLEYTDDGLRALARVALQRKTGARALRAVMEELLLDVMFELPTLRGGRYLIDEEAVQSGSPRRQPERSAA
jgi:ATP-dependent Clp protease ATP-binding subunit ClpX